MRVVLTNAFAAHTRTHAHTHNTHVGIGGASNMYNGLWDACVKIGREEGVAGFYRGLIPCYLKVVPAAAIGWACIETLQKVERDFLSATN